MFWVTVAGLVAVVLYTVVTYCQLDETRQDRRPWVVAPDIEATAKNDEAVFKLTFKNVGSTATTSLYIGASNIGALHTLNGDGMRKIVDKNCTDGKGAINDPLKLNRRYSISPDASFYMIDVAPFVQTKFRLSDAVKDPMLAGCVVYGSKIAGKLHQTGFITHLFVENGSVHVQITETIDAD